MNIFILTASHRKDSLNAKLAMLAERYAMDKGFATYRPEYAIFDCPPYSEVTFDSTGVPINAMAFVDALVKADGIIFAVPEYNWSFPGSLKNLIDWASRVEPSPFKDKIVLLMSATLSQRGGASCIQQLRFPLEMLDMIVAPRAFMLGGAHQAFNLKNKLIEKRHEKLFAVTMDAYLRLLTALGTQKA